MNWLKLLRVMQTSVILSTITIECLNRVHLHQSVKTSLPQVDQLIMLVLYCPGTMK